MINAKTIISINRLSKIYDHYNLIEVDPIDLNERFGPVAHKINEVLDIKGTVLAGGFYTAKKNSDLDFYFTKLPNLEHLENLFKNCEKIESKWSINYVYKNFQFQFIKCIYKTPANIVAGFDMDPCRVFMYKDSNIRVFMTVGAFVAYETKTHPIDISICDSASRVHKYNKKKGFKPIHINGSRMNNKIVKYGFDSVKQKYLNDKLWVQAFSMFTDENYYIFDEIFTKKQFLSMENRLTCNKYVFIPDNLSVSKIIEDRYEKYLKSQKTTFSYDSGNLFPVFENKLYIDWKYAEIYPKDLVEKCKILYMCLLRKSGCKAVSHQILRQFVIDNFIDKYKYIEDLYVK